MSASSTPPAARLSRRLRRPHHHRRRPRHRIQGDPDHPSPADSSAPKSPSISTACTPQIACSIHAAGNAEGTVTHRRSRRRRPRHTSLPAHHLGRSPRRNQTKIRKHHRPTRPRSHPALFLRRHPRRAQRRFHGPPFLPPSGRFATGALHLLRRRRTRSAIRHRHQNGTEPEQFVHSRYIIAWASNIHGNNVHSGPSSKKLAAKARSWSSSTRTAREPRSWPTGTCPSILAPMPRWLWA